MSGPTSEYVFKLPDLGEGTVEAEIVEWHVKPGDAVQEGQIIADVMTDKANVEVPAPVSGVVLRISGEPGDVVAVGSELAAFQVPAGKTAGAQGPTAAAAERQQATEAAAAGGEPTTAAAKPAGGAAAAATPSAAPVPPPAAQEVAAAPPPVPPEPAASEPAPTPAPTSKVITSPAIRRRAKEAGIDLSTIRGTGPRGRILRADLETAMSGTGAPGQPASAPTGTGAVTEIKVIGVRRVIANRLQAAKREIPHFAYVEEVDVTALESLRSTLNGRRRQEQPALTYLPFIALALIRGLREFPHVNSHYDAETGVLRQYERVHLGVATQTPDGLKVPVVHNADSRSLWELATEISRVAEAARSNSASRQELTGSTITITSLGRLGGIVSTPIINAPEMGIIGVNKAVKRPMVVDDQVTVRLMMNLSSSFDHRFVDGFDAAALVQAMKAFLEEPATLFIP